MDVLFARSPRLAFLFSFDGFVAKFDEWDEVTVTLSANARAVEAASVSSFFTSHITCIKSQEEQHQA